ncbi:CDP-diacylglycerol--serine O-phosphatidyltransferase [Anaerolineales bacterium HSG24]|nr:CDP-diacylglycerol--serine O-phosphatidyltransferase [Anaerolineales bacterium HSG24]
MPRQITLILPSIATLSSLMFGTVAIMVLSDKEFLLAATLILLGSILDVLDGQLAQRLEAVSDIGKELDSLADVVTFGVAPTILLYHLMLQVGVIQPIAILSSLAFVVAGAFRLARFNTTPSNRSAYFQGMPIPMGSILLITGSFWQGWAINVWWTIVVVTVSYLMISPFAYPKIKHISDYSPIVWAGVCAIGLLVGLTGGWQAVPFGLMVLYAISGPILSIWFAKTKNSAV